LIAAVPAYAQAQPRSTPKVGDAQKVVTIISGDKAKTQTYCDMKKLAEQIEEASAKKDAQTVNELSQKVEALEKTLGPEYAALLDGLQGVLEDDLDAEVISSFASLDRLCTR
jgi:ABC-type transporter Mla subunit MlaD